jgi:hypothetical protein
MQASNNSEVIENLKPKRGRPKTVTVDKKEYQKQYRINNREILAEKDRQYYAENKDKILENLKSDPIKYEERMRKFKEHGNMTHKKALCIYKIIKELTSSGVLTLPESHKDIILELIN